MQLPIYMYYKCVAHVYCSCPVLILQNKTGYVTNETAKQRESHLATWRERERDRTCHAVIKNKGNHTYLVCICILI